jgi:hypothetical protein
MKNSRSLLAMLALSIAPISSFAHHGTVGTYDQDKVVRVSGVVKQFVWRQPHCVLVLAGQDASGKDVTYSFEIGGPSGLAKQGMSRNSFKPGDTVELDMHPAFGNPNVGQPATRSFVINGKEVKRIIGGDSL